MRDRLIVALDVPRIAMAEALVEQLDNEVSFYKIGLWLAFAEGVDGLIRRLVSSGKRVFLDTKMYDIGQTVAEGVARAAERGVTLVTVHGDPEIMQAACAAAKGTKLEIFAVTVLTSLNDAALAAMGYRHTASELVALRARQAALAGCHGIIASALDNPNEIRRQAAAPNLRVATPGIRPAGADTNDHKRLATPATAIAAGADYLVVGRPIIASPDPLAATRAILAEMSAA
jgi:orotidine-5'-phosphate decarboxylase